MNHVEDPNKVVLTNRRAQQALYGESLEVRLGAIMRDYGISQRRLALVLGISAPMLSLGCARYRS